MEIQFNIHLMIFIQTKDIDKDKLKEIKKETKITDNLKMKIKKIIQQLETIQ